MSSDKVQMAEAGDKVQSPPTAVSFFDPALKAARRSVFFQWGRTGQCSIISPWVIAARVLTALLPSLGALRLHSLYPLLVLGR